MVFCGKPSKGCETCRVRKIRCDQLPGGCSQCTKVHKTCPGYRDQLDLMFRDESEAVVSKARSKETRASGATETRKPLSFSAPSSIPSSHGLPMPPSENFHRLLEQRNQAAAAAASVPSTFTMTPTLQEMATGFFFSHYVVRVNGPSLGHLAQLDDIYNTPAADENLITSMNAVGIAGYSHIAKAPHLIADARAQYAKALRLTNAALKSPVDVKKDSTLLSIMILGIFEVITGGNQRSLTAWAQHINGAAALLKLRGMEQMRTLAGRSMYIQVCTNLLITCIQQKLPMPADILQLRAQIAKYVNPDDIAWQIQDAMIELADFRSRTRRGTLSDPHVILSTSLRLDRHIANLFLDVPPTWQYRTVLTDADPDIVFDGRYHVYYDFWFAQIWNAMRSFRILLNEEIRLVLLQGFSSIPPRFTGPEYTAQLQMSTDVLFRMQADILASVPEFLGYIPKHASSPLRSILTRLSSPDQLQSNFLPATDAKSKLAGHSPEIKIDPPRLRASGGFFILWPLFLAGRVVITTPRIRQWVCQCMRRVGNSTGIHHALVAASMLEKGEDIQAMDEKPTVGSLVDSVEDIEPG